MTTASVSYRAAVVSLNPNPYAGWNGTSSDARSLMLQNVARVDAWASKAARAGAQIVVFPEDCISSFGGGGPHWVSRYVTPLLFSEPLPAKGQRMCDTATQHAAPVASALACVARKHRIVLVVGLGISAPCQQNRLQPMSTRSLPCDAATKRSAYDGAAAFGPDGVLLGKHRKSHLAYDWAGNPDVWDEAPVEASFFDAPFGVRFGLMVRTMGSSVVM